MNETILKALKEAFPDKEFSVEVMGQENILYIDGKRSRIKWLSPTNNLASGSSIVSIIIRNVGQTLTGTIFGKAKLSPKTLANWDKPKKKEEIPPKEEEKKIEESIVEEIKEEEKVVEEEKVEAPAAEPAPKKKKSSKKKKEE